MKAKRQGRERETHTHTQREREREREREERQGGPPVMMLMRLRGVVLSRWRQTTAFAALLSPPSPSPPLQHQHQQQTTTATPAPCLSASHSKYSSSSHPPRSGFQGTTILCVRKNDEVVLIGDGQVSQRLASFYLHLRKSFIKSFSQYLKNIQPER